MQICYILATLLAAVSCELIILKKTKDGLWKEYKEQYGKLYSVDEENTRKQNWLTAIDAMQAHNSGNHSYTIGLNHLSDMSEEELQELASKYDQKYKCEYKSMVYAPPPDNGQIPENIDWRKYGYVTEVLNQGKCGACWAFAAVGSLEGQHKRITGELVKLSEQQLIDCSTITGNHKCGGGQMCRAYEAATTLGGVDTYSYYPYQDRAEDCRFSPQHIGSIIKGYLELPYGDEYALKMAVALLGPVAAGFNGYLPSFVRYKGGIFDDPNCSNTTLDHALTVIGYGVENGKDYWLVKNSWSTHWGENGFAKIARNKNNMCGIASAASFPVLDQYEDGTPKLTGPPAL